MPVVIGAFCLSLVVFIAIGIYSIKNHEKSTEDYLVAGRSVSPWLTALSAVATNNSGFMFIGLVGYAYTSGVEAVWMMVGWLLGDLVAWFFVHRKVRERSGELSANSVPQLVGTDRDGTVSRPIVALTALATLIFLGVYAAGQLKAGATALESLFGWPPSLGATLGAAIVAIYCYSGGLRASIWTDAAQSIAMFVAIAVLVFTAALQVGGPASLVEKLNAIDPQLLDISPASMRFGVLAFVLGWAAGGFGAVGQPHILIRTMALRAPSDIPRTRLIYFAWFVPFFAMAIGIGLHARILLPDLLASGAHESALPKLSLALLPEPLIGLVLAGLFSATMSTADSQLLSCSAAVTQDLFPRWRTSYRASKIATLSIAAVALAIALGGPESVFAIVLWAWAGLAATIGPVLIVRILHQPLTTPIALGMMLTGALTIAGWDIAGLDGAIYKLLPGILIPLAFYAICRKIALSGE